MRRLISLAALAVFSLIFAACGGSAEFDQEEFQKTVLVAPPAGLTVKLSNIPTDDISGIDSVEATVTVNTSPRLLQLDLTLSGSTSISLNIIATEDAAYMNVGQGWLKAPPTGDLTDLAEGFGGGFNSDELTAGTWEYIAEIPCGEDTCWQVESEHGILMNLRADDYTPVSATIVEDGVNITLDIVHWGDTVDVELPADAREVTSEELMFSLLGALMPLIAGGL